ncbi:hypothetical protein BDP27DRAFT_1345978 [Rhodocollybia butyracea]|uniref:Secreted protein n=1 Tax=Rhodocollybia butyracea TaxID=206335 RepID=A0A9P5TXU7_9AGAR|nr:hypothetical protein BDP27DRAFT_1345978 [Rhodocollybia butyracea]
MHSTTLLFIMLLASSILAVFSVPVPGPDDIEAAAGPPSQNQSRKRPLEQDSPGQDKNPKSQKTTHPGPRPLVPLPVVTFITRMGADKGGVFPTENYTSHLNRVFNEALNSVEFTMNIRYEGMYAADPQEESPSPLRGWIYFKLIGFGPCRTGNVCFGWIVNGSSYVILRGKNSAPSKKGRKLYMGMTAGPMVQNGFGTSEVGQPPLHPAYPQSVRNPAVLPKMQEEWVRLRTEFDLRFMVPNFRPHGVPPPNVGPHGGPQRNVGNPGGPRS